MDFRHLSVMPEEVLYYLNPKSGGVYVDGTVGGAGHAALILEASAPDGLLIGFDRDKQALAVAAERLAPFGNRVRLLHRNFSDIASALAELGIGRLDGLLLDLGVSSPQLDKAERGFSFQQDAPLDMRMDQESGETAAELVNRLTERELETIIREFGEERWARRIAAFVVKAREEKPVATTFQLVEIIKGAIPKAKWEKRLHPATRTFQALRIAVNEELLCLEKGMAVAFNLLKKGGRMVVISFHSLEDRMVKNSFRSMAQGCECPKEIPVCVCGKTPGLKVITGRPVVPGAAELAVNVRARSARLRAAERL